MIYVNIDGKWHLEVGHADGTITTECGIEDIPYGAEWSHDAPDKLCAKCKKAAA